jgi:hypothetical protein
MACIRLPSDPQDEHSAKTRVLGELVSLHLTENRTPESFPTLAALKVTCRYFYHLINLASYNPTKQDIHRHLVEAETWPLYRSCTADPDVKYLACSECVHLLPSSRFGDSQQQRHRKLGGKEARTRFCFDCGVKEGRYRRGARHQIGFAGKYWLICHQCGDVMEWPEFPSHKENNQECRECEENWVEDSSESESESLRELGAQVAQMAFFGKGWVGRDRSWG